MSLVMGVYLNKGFELISSKTQGRAFSVIESWLLIFVREKNILNLGRLELVSVKLHVLVCEV